MTDSSVAVLPWSFTIEFDEGRARRNGYDSDTLYEYVGRSVEPLGNVRVARGTWRAAEGADEVMAQVIALRRLMQASWFMDNAKAVSAREDEAEGYDWLALVRRTHPELVTSA